MKNEELIIVLEQLEEKAGEFDLLGSRQQKTIEAFRTLRHQFSDIEVPKRFQEVYDSLISKGKKLQQFYRVNADVKDVRAKTNYYLNYCNAAYGDFTGQVNNIQGFYRIFLLCSILFLALSPMFLTPIFPLLFVFPIFLAMRGIKQRSKTGFWIGMLIVPVSLMTSVMWIRNGIYVLGNYTQAVSQMAESSGMGMGVSTVLTVVCPILGSALFVLAIVLALQGKKVRKLFI